MPRSTKILALTIAAWASAVALPAQSLTLAAPTSVTSHVDGLQHLVASKCFPKGFCAKWPPKGQHGCLEWVTKVYCKNPDPDGSTAPQHHPKIKIPPPHEKKFQVPPLHRR